jgi:hypothetical protein
LEPFVTAVFGASERLWILDPHFDHEHGLSPILFGAILESQAEVRIVSKKELPRDWLEAQTNWADVRGRFFWQTRPCSWLHGRFALLDSELWHFGSTVGGAYPGFDAASRWYDPALVASFSYHFSDTWDRSG